MTRSGYCLFLTLGVQERELIPSAVVDEIITLNNLDMELYEHARVLFAKQQRHFVTSTYPQVLLLNRTSNQNGCLIAGVLFFTNGESKCATSSAVLTFTQLVGLLVLLPIWVCFLEY